MSKMVDRVALALAKASGINDWAKSAHEFEEDARAAIEALRDPTDEMLQAQFGKAGPRECWQAMIDAALSDSNGERNANG